MFDSLEKRIYAENQIAQGVKIFRNQHEKQNDNEIDVMWTENNQPMLVNAKYHYGNLRWIL